MASDTRIIFKLLLRVVLELPELTLLKFLVGVVVVLVVAGDGGGGIAALLITT